MRRVTAVALLSAALLAALTGCFPAAPAPSVIDSSRAQPLSVTPSIPLVNSNVLAYCPAGDAQHFSGYPLATDEVYICRGDGHHVTDGVSTYGPWESASRISHPAALLTAYSQANGRRARSCPPPSTTEDPLIIWVHRDGVTRAYYAPVDGCGLPKPAARLAYQAAHRTLIVEFDRGGPIAPRKNVNG